MTTNCRDTRFCLLRSGKDLEIAEMTESELHDSGREGDLLGIPFTSREAAEEQKYFLLTAGIGNVYATR